MKTIPIIVIIGLLVVVQGAHATAFGDVSPYFSFTYGDGGGIPGDVTNVSGQQISSDGLTTTLFGNLGPIDGARFASGFVLAWSGPFSGPINPGDKYAADLNFDVHATGGTLAYNIYSYLYSDENSEHADIVSDNISISGTGSVGGSHFESSLFTQHGDTGYFAGYLHIEWSGFSPTDTLSIDVPQNSFVVTYMAVPEPSVASLAFLIFLTSQIWRFIYPKGRRYQA